MMSNETAENLVMKRHDLLNRIEGDPVHAGELRVELEDVEARITLEVHHRQRAALGLE
jgi:hypothetical protein